MPLLKLRHLFCTGRVAADADPFVFLRPCVREEVLSRDLAEGLIGRMSSV